MNPTRNGTARSVGTRISSQVGIRVRQGSRDGSEVKPCKISGEPNPNHGYSGRRQSDIGKIRTAKQIERRTGAGGGQVGIWIGTLRTIGTRLRPSARNDNCRPPSRSPD